MSLTAYSTFVTLLFIDASSSLKCYQCNSSNIDLKPNCDRLYWKQLDTKEKDDLIIDCPLSISSFCVVLKNPVGVTEGKKNVIITTRGCVGKKDSIGTELHTGCVTSSKSEIICLCADDLCNAADRVSPKKMFIAIIIVTLLGMKSF